MMKVKVPKERLRAPLPQRLKKNEEHPQRYGPWRSRSLVQIAFAYYESSQSRTRSKRHLPTGTAASLSGCPQSTG